MSVDKSDCTIRRQVTCFSCWVNGAFARRQIGPALQRDGVVRGDDTVLVARLVWAVVHGVGMLGIDGQLPDPGAVEELMQYAFERVAAAIGASAT